LQTPYAKRKLLNTLNTELSNTFKTTFTVEKAKFLFFNKIELENVYLEDLHKDTLLFVPTLTVNYSLAGLFHKKAIIKKAALTKADIRLNTNAKDGLNLQFFIDALSKNPKDTTVKKAKWDFELHRVDIIRSHFKYQRFPIVPKAKGINFNNIDLVYFDAQVFNFQFKKGLTSFDVLHITAVDRSGFLLRRFSTQFSFSQNFLHFDNLRFTTQNSNFATEYVHLDYNKSTDISSDFIHRVRISANILESELSMSDLAYFAPGLWGLTEKVNIQGLVSGTVNDLKGKNLQLRYGNDTRFSGNLSFNGLPDIAETFIYADIYRLTSNSVEVEKLIKGYKNKETKLPPILDKLGKIEYIGKFTGFLNDFVAYGRIDTDLGRLHSDISFKPDTSRTTHFTGKISASNFDLSKLTNPSSKVGKISLTADANGVFGNNKIDVTFNTQISALAFNNYNYQNINAEGRFADKNFQGKVDIDDPNIFLAFNGDIDYSFDQPKFHFNAQINHANLYRLNWIKNDTTLTLSTNMSVNFSGTNIDLIKGDADISLFKLAHKGSEMEMNNLNINADNYGLARKITINSDQFDASLSGNFKLQSVAQYFGRAVSTYAPSIFNPDKYKDYIPGNFTYTVNLKNVSDILNFFVPKLYVAKNSTIEGDYNGNNQKIAITASAGFVKFNTKVLRKINLYTNGDNHQLDIKLQAEQLLLKADTTIQNIRFSTSVANNAAVTNLYWVDKNNNAQQSHISSHILLEARQNHFPAVKMEISPTEIFLNDSVWQINNAEVQIDTNFIAFNHFSIHNTRQFLQLDGRISADPNDTLKLNVNQLELSLLSKYIRQPKFDFEGEICGTANLTNLYTNPTIQSNLTIDNFVMNKEFLGKLIIESVWNNTDKQLQLNADIYKKTLKTLSLSGVYTPSNNDIDFVLKTDKLRLNQFDVFARPIFTNLFGMLSGKANITGKLNNMLVNGDFKLQKISFGVDYLKTNYTFSTDVSVENNVIVIPKTVVNDAFSNICYLSGSVDCNHFPNVTLDLLLRPEKFACLNTKEGDNNLFYGKAFGSGRISIKGTPQKMAMNIVARCDKNTLFVIPVNTRSELHETNIVSFVKHTDEKASKEEDPLEYLKKQEYKVNTGGITMNFELEITPDAELQLVFDKKVGDVMKGRGSGSLKLEINTQGKFGMYGNLRITEGEYLFTLQSVINKKFIVQDGSTIQWSGNALDADIDIATVYRLKTTLPDYMLDANESRRRVQVDCAMNVKGKLTKPNITYGVDLPTADEETKSRLKNIISTEDELNKHFLSLLIINSFYPDASQTTSSSGGIGSSASKSLPSEFLSNQLSNWASQVSDKFDMGVNYRPGDETTTQQLEVELSTHLLDDRMTITTNFGQAGAQVTSTGKTSSAPVGDFNVDYKISKDGKLRLKAFNRTNDQLIYEQSPYTQGIGVFYREEFNSVGDIFKRKPKTEAVKPEDQTEITDPEKTDNKEDKTKTSVIKEEDKKPETDNNQ
jgi:hypothetical protein